MDVSSEQPEGQWVGVAGRSPVHCETFGATVRCDSKYGGVCTIFIVGVSGRVERLEERPDVPYMDLSRLCPSGDIVGLGDGRQGSRCREGLSPNAINAAKVRNGSEFEEGILVQSICIVLVIGTRVV